MKKNLIFFIFVLFCVFLPRTVFAYDIGKVTGDFVSVKSKSNGGGSTLNKVIFGTKVTILEEFDNYYKVIYDGANTGYMSKSYVKKDSEYKLDDPVYCKTLMDAGFPETYCPYLSFLHKKHPTWIFKPLNTNLDFYGQVVDGEEGQNYIQSTEDAYRASEKLMEAGGWYMANQTVVAYMLDPRNFLHEKSIFMFENLSYVEREDTKDVLASIFGPSSFLTTDKDNGNSYIDYYIEAGRTHTVSPIHLAARTVQEGASNISYGAVSGEYTGQYRGYSLKGFYNFFNIGAYADSYTKNPMLRGIAYAAGYTSASQTNLSHGRPWKTRKDAIFGGASFIAKNYIKKGQYTLYFEKFNTNSSSKNSLYTNQYMTNIFAPYSEACNIKKSYAAANILEVPYEFVIPVYKNMPDETKQPTLLSGNNILSGIYLDGKLLDGFDSDITEYTQYFLDEVLEIDINAVSNSVDAKVEGTGKIELLELENDIVIKVTAQNGDVLEYKIKIIRVQDTTKLEDIVAKLSVKEKEDYLYGISVETAASTLLQSIEKISPSAKVTIVDALGNEKKDKNLATGDKITIKTLVDKPKTYKISIIGDVNGDGTIDIKDLLRVQKHLLGTSALKDEYYLSGDINSDNDLNVQDLLRIQKHILGSIKL